MGRHHVTGAATAAEPNRHSLMHPRALLYSAGCYANLHHMARRRNAEHLLILAYHGLREPDRRTGWDWPLLPEPEFERQMRYLARHYRVLPIDDALDGLATGGFTEPTAVITFDDGYRSVHALAGPILRRLRLPATVFLATGLINTSAILWTARIGMAFFRCRRSDVDLSCVGWGHIRLHQDPRRREAVARQVVSQLKQIPPAQRNPLVAQVLAAVGEAASDHDSYRMMTWAEVESLQNESLVTFGGHTVNHEILSRLDDAAVEEEVSGSIREIERRLHAVSHVFAYPNGTQLDFDQRSIDAVRRAGARAAVTTIEGFTRASTDPYALRRFNIGGAMSFDEFRMVTSGAVRRGLR